jgi:hypothetical protein
MLRFMLAITLALGLALTATAEEKAESKAKGAFVHVVVFTMKKGTSTESIDEVIKDCKKMLGKISAVRHVKAGRPATDATPKLAKKNYDVALLIVVDDAAGLKSYLEDPLHLEFVKKHGKLFEMEKLQVFDFLDGK